MTYIIAKIKELYKSYGHDVWAVFCILLATIIGYNLGRINALEKAPITLRQNAALIEAVKGQTDTSPLFKAGENSANIPAPTPRDPRVVVSKSSSSKKYHYSWCASWKKIKPENQVWYSTEQIAQQAGYTLAGNCSD